MDSSGYRILDDEAMAAVTKAAPFNRFPPGFKRKILPIEGMFIYERSRGFFSR
jgi:outer membrane biosynthesis protein TonB